MKNDVKHLYSRAGFGSSPREWSDKSAFSRREAIDDLFDQAEKRNNPLPEMKNMVVADIMAMERKDKRKANQQLTAQQNIQWIRRMSDPSESALLEKMTLFWHGHFACKPDRAHYAFAYAQTIRKHALGNFGDFVLAIAKDPAMIFYLNNQQNRKRSPNENFAREVLELFTIGIGNYTEQDVKEAARAFTGWTAKKMEATYQFKAKQHDDGMKKFMGEKGRFNGDDVIKIILSKPKTAEFITTNIYPFFVNEVADQQIIKTLAREFFASNYDIKKLMRTIFSSDWFYEQKNIGNQIKSPVYLIANLLRTLDVQFKYPMVLVRVQQALGQTLFDPPNVAGWPGGKAWIDNTTLLLRLNLTTYLFQSARTEFVVRESLKAAKKNKVVKQMDAIILVDEMASMWKSASYDTIFSELTTLLLSNELTFSNEDFKRLRITTTDHKDFIKKVILSLTTLPEFQVC